MEINYLARLQVGRVTYEVYRWKETSLRKKQNPSLTNLKRGNVRCLKTQRNSYLEKGDVSFSKLEHNWFTMLYNKHELYTYIQPLPTSSPFKKELGHKLVQTKRAYFRFETGGCEWCCMTQDSDHRLPHREAQRSKAEVQISVSTCKEG